MSRRPPVGVRALAAPSLVLSALGLLWSVTTGRLDALVLGVVHGVAAYGFWSGAGWGWMIGALAYGVVGGAVTALRSADDPVELTLALALAAGVTGYVLSVADLSLERPLRWL